MAATKDALGILIKRRHPEYVNKIEHWNFLEASYNGGRDWFKNNLFRYLKEGDKEYTDRVARAYRFNHSREIVDLVSKYIFKAKINRNTENADENIKLFWDRSTRGGAPIQKFMREVSKQSSVFGRVWIVVDNNNRGNVKTLADEKSANAREYAYIVKPQNVLDLSYDENGDLNWILISETNRDDNDPFVSTGAQTTRYRLWTKNDWYLIGTRIKQATPLAAGTMLAPIVNAHEQDKQMEEEPYIVSSGKHNLGVVPVFAHDHTDTEELYTSPSLICDIAYLDRAVANYLSNLDAIIQDQTFSQLAMPVQGTMPGEDITQKMTEMGTKRIFTYDGGESGNQPFYLSPDPQQANLIVTAITKIINEIYHTVGMAGERTKQDNAVGIDNSSGVAKAYDFERVNALLTSKGAALQKAELKMLELVMRWNGKVPNADELAKLVVYPETFDTRGLADEFDIASSLLLVEAPLAMRQEQMRVIVKKLFPIIKDSDREKMMGEIDAMLDPLAQLEQEQKIVAANKPQSTTGKQPKQNEGAK